MRRLVLGAATAAATLLAGEPRLDPFALDRGPYLVAQAQAHRESRVSFSLFYNSMRPYGRWAQLNPYGAVFIPRVPRDWRPYSEGRWVYNARYGWVWDSDEPFGWAAFHYGWWDYSDRWGWFWVPGYEWAPSWVVWRIGPDFVGWAPMPARYVWGRPYIEISILWQDDYWRSPRHWCFTQNRHMGDRHARHVIAPVHNNVTYIDRSTAIYNTTVINNTIVNHGPDITAMEDDGGAHVTRAEVNPVAEPPAATSGDTPAGDGTVVNAYMPDPQAAVNPAEVIAAPSDQTFDEVPAPTAPHSEPSVAGASQEPEPAADPIPLNDPENGATGTIPEETPPPMEAPVLSGPDSAGPGNTEPAPMPAMPQDEPSYPPPPEPEASAPPPDDIAPPAMPDAAPAYPSAPELPYLEPAMPEPEMAPSAPEPEYSMPTPMPDAPPPDMSMPAPMEMPPPAPMPEPPAPPPAMPEAPAVPDAPPPG